MSKAAHAPGPAPGPGPELVDLSLDAADFSRGYLADEAESVQSLCDIAQCTPALCGRIEQTARQLVEAVRRRQRESSGLHAFLQHYDLSSHEGVVLMCLAESLLRIPDAETADRLIADKLTSANWRRHLGGTGSLFVNASTWALMLTGRMIQVSREARDRPGEFLTRLAGRMEEPVIRTALKSAMRIMAHQFVMGRTIHEALARAETDECRSYRYSFDMLGEAVLTARDADRYQAAYTDAIVAAGAHGAQSAPLPARPGISVKLSALCPRFDYRQASRAIRELSRRLLALACLARDAGIGLTVDAEEADRLEIMLAVFESVYRCREFSGWPGLGLAVQAYQKRALPVLRWLIRLAGAHGRMIPVRLVKGAYWDTEIKRAQESGWEDYPVYTRKSNTDVSYLACAKILLEQGGHLYPQFATHNAHTVAWVYHHAQSREYEFQRLHGMGAELYAEVVGAEKLDVPCRVYAPVGAHEDLLPYLVRRLLENGANTSFVNQIVHDAVPVDAIIADPVRAARAAPGGFRNPGIPLPAALFGLERKNSAGMNFANRKEAGALLEWVRKIAARRRRATPLVGGEACVGQEISVFDPAHIHKKVGIACWADEQAAQNAIATAARAWPEWDARPAVERAAVLERAADLYEAHRAELLALCVREAGRTVPDGFAEIREAVDFLRYYAVQCRKCFREPLHLPGPTGESNALFMRGRGVFMCISPWNFPVAIFTGQIAAALAAGNSVIAKPAEQTPLAAHLAISLLHRAGAPPDVLNFLPGEGKRLGKAVLADARIAGVAFTGSVETAHAIYRLLAARKGPLPVFIAETGGLNAMIADSSALPEQLVIDAVQSAFNSAGQRCSALRVLFLQREIADRVIELTKGHMDELVVGDPLELATDVGPVIDATARGLLEAHIKSLSRRGYLIYRCPRRKQHEAGHFVQPTLLELERMSQLPGEIFGPVLHLIRYRAEQLDEVIDDINTCGYGLTLGIHSRIEDTVEYIRARVRVGNVYVNRNMIGAVVGVQPFGGCGLSGTGPKAGGPHYLPRFATEQTLTVNTAAIGGNAALLGGT